MTAVPNVELNNGVHIPQLGFGVFQVPPSDTQQVVEQALEIGYRHIDTAEMYGNEAGVGAALRAAGLPRDQVFVTSKLNNGFHHRDDAVRAFDGTLAALGFDYLDLFLIHWPLPSHDTYVEAWQTLEGIYAEGRARAIGVSNFHVAHLDRLAGECDVVPAANQIESHPYLQQDVLHAADAARGIATEAWSPIARGRCLNDPVLLGIAAEHDVSSAQVALRWAIQRGDIVFPKSVDPVRMASNFDLFSFELSDEDMAAIATLDRGERTGPDPDQFDWIPKS
ncbi:MAG: aldo/keto reductase [Candidatus Nanopelagicales bacterium]